MDPLRQLRTGLGVGRGGILTRRLPAFPVFLYIGFVCACAARAASPQPGPPLTTKIVSDDVMTELGCVYCHTDLPNRSRLREYTPDLSSAGLRYQPAYLFQFLQDPGKVRRHLGRARMPDYHLSPKEALALTAFLETQRALSEPAVSPAWPATTLTNAQPAARTAEEARTVLAEEGLFCLNCHTWAGQGGAVGVELSRVSSRLQPDWVRQFLVAPHLFGVAPGIMPAQFFETTGQGFREMQPKAAEKLLLIVQNLFVSGAGDRERDQARAAWEAARSAFPQVDARQGEALFRAFNCAACHRIQAMEPRAAAPHLAGITNRVTQAWLQGYLRRHVPIRPFGYSPGDGSRMPDFHLNEAETAEVARLLMGNKAPDPQRPAGSTEPSQRLSAFSRRKARLLLTEKLSCLGCHRLDGRGGRIGPDLSNVSSRLRSEYVWQMIKEPAKGNPHSIMPKLPLDDDTARLIADFLLQQEPPDTKGPEPYLSPLEFPLILPARPSSGEVQVQASLNYAKYCAACHGNAGQGDGFNAAFLPVKPTVHADALVMTTRADDTVYDGIHAGGAILGKSPYMPAWGGVLSPKEITALVTWIRNLCDCQGPGWSAR